MKSRPSWIRQPTLLEENNSIEEEVVVEAEEAEVEVVEMDHNAINARDMAISRVIVPLQAQEEEAAVLARATVVRPRPHLHLRKNSWRRCWSQATHQQQGTDSTSSDW